MKKLHNKMIVGALVGVMALGGLLQVEGIKSVAHAAPKRVYEREMKDFIRSQRILLYLPKLHDRHPDHIQSREYSSLDEFKKGVVSLPKGWYLAKLGLSSVIFEKRK